MSRSTLRPVIKLRSTAGTGYTYVTRKSRRNDPDRLVVRKYDPTIGRHVDFRERSGDPTGGQNRSTAGLVPAMVSLAASTAGQAEAGQWSLRRLLVLQLA